MLTDGRLRTLLMYCKLWDLRDDEEVQELIPIFYGDAVGYLQGAGISPPAEGSPKCAQYDLLVDRLVLDSWESRGGQTTEAVREDPAFRRTLNQLKQSDPAFGF